MNANSTKQKDIENKVLSYCEKAGMFQAGDKVVLGVSGGADSVCLLFVLMELWEQLGIRLYVVHVNHGVRQDAGDDAEYVEELCRRHGIPFLLEEIRLKELAAEWKTTQEEAGRIARYRAFDKACERYDCQKIAVAHNSNDRAETMLFHLFRGTGLRGMAGMLPVRGQIVRPLLCLEREEIECYLEERQIPFRQDSTNAGDDYTRNRIRHHILPYAQQNIVESAVRNMCRSADIFAQEEQYMEEQASAAGKFCVQCRTKGAEGEWLKPDAGNGYTVSVEVFLSQHPVIQRRLLLMLLKELSPRHQDIASVHIEEILSLFEKEGNRRICLPYRITGERSYGMVRLERSPEEMLPREAEQNRWRKENNAPETESCWTDEIPTDVLDGLTLSLWDGAKIQFCVLENVRKVGEIQVFSENRYTKWFDYGKIKQPLLVRTRRTGDYLTIRGKDAMQHKKLKDYMVTEKIPKKERDCIPVLAEGEHVLWLVGYRISEYYKVDANTTKILQAEFIPSAEE